MAITDSATAASTSTLDRLLAAAAASFRHKGYEATRTRELAKALGIQSASLYYHMGKKEDLLYALCVDTGRRIYTSVAGAMAEFSDHAERLRAMIRTHLVSSLEDQDRHATMLFELRALSAERRQEVVQMRADYEALFRQTIEEAQAAGAVRCDVDAKYLTLALLNLLNWSIFWFRDDGHLTAAQLAELLITIFFEGVGGLVSQPSAPVDLDELADTHELHPA